MPAARRCAARQGRYSPALPVASAQPGGHPRPRAGTEPLLVLTDDGESGPSGAHSGAGTRLPTGRAGRVEANFP